MKKLTIVLLLILPLIRLSALPDSRDVLTGLDRAVIDSLYADGQVFRYDDEKAGIRFLLCMTGSAGVLQIHRRLNPTIMVEALYSIPWPAELESEKENLSSVFFELAYRVSSIAGVKFYPDFGKRYKVLFSDVYAVDNPDDRNRIPDPEPPPALDSGQLFVHMTERMLGSGYYRIGLEKSPGMMTVQLTNETSLGFLFPAVEPRGLKIVLYFIPCSDRILAYGYSAAVLENEELVSLVLDPYDAFYRRLTAMENWLHNSLHGTDRLPPLYEPMP